MRAWRIITWSTIAIAFIFSFLVSGCSKLKVPLASPLRDGTPERWCAAAREGSAIYGVFTNDLDAQVFIPAPSPPAPPMTNRGDRGAAVVAWQQHLEDRGFSPGEIDGMHGPQTERATEAWLRTGRSARAISSERTATPWGADYQKAKSIVEALRGGILALCQSLDKGEQVTKGDLLDRDFERAAEAFGDIVETHQDVIVSRSSRAYDHDKILRELRIVQAEATAAAARTE